MMSMLSNLMGRVAISEPKIEDLPIKSSFEGSVYTRNSDREPWQFAYAAAPQRAPCTLFYALTPPAS